MKKVRVVAQRRYIDSEGCPLVSVEFNPSSMAVFSWAVEDQKFGAGDLSKLIELYDAIECVLKEFHPTWGKLSDPGDDPKEG